MKVALTTGLSLAMSSLTLAARPDYRGTLCPEGVGHRMTIQCDPDTTLALVYPDPPGGGWMMTRDAPGIFSHVLDTVPVGTELRFRLVLQNPVQHEFPEHVVPLTGECRDFERDDVTPPPPRGFRHEFVIDDETVRVRFQAGADLYNNGETTAVSLRYRRSGADLQTLALTPISPGQWEGELPDAAAGQTIDYWFHQLIGIQPQDTALLTTTLGEVSTEPQWPLISTRTGRFRHRHPNEWRFDNYVEDYGIGKSFELTLTDWGTRVEVALAIDEDLAVNRVDFRYFAWNDPFSDTCNRPETLVNQIMSGGQNHFTHVVEEVTPGTIIDFDLTFQELPTPGLQYYSEFFYYRVGLGTFGGPESDPRVSPVGEAAAAHVFSPRFGFAQHAATLDLEALRAFMDGKVIFETDFQTADLLNFSTHFDCCAGPIGQPRVTSPAFTPGVLGPRYAAASCIECHVMDGRGPTPQPGIDLMGLVAQTGVPGSDPFGAPLGHPHYGRQLDVRAVGPLPPEGRIQVTYEEIPGVFDDGTPYSLRRPTYRFLDMAYGSLGTNVPDVDGTAGYGGPAEFSPRIAPQLAGLGMLEAVSDATILAREDPGDLDGDGISGRANRVWDAQTQSPAIGRFGWKANQPTLRQQTSEAFRRDLGITTPLHPNLDCGAQQPECDPGSGLPELAGGALDEVEAYLRGLTLPPRRNHTDPRALSGMRLFKAANCQACHVPTLRTGPTHPIAAYRNLTIEPFTDLLLHDMGPDLADDRPHFEASGREWRTPPLWGLSYVQHALGLPETCDDPTSGAATPNFLHDGRARSLMEAILWHGGEAEASRRAVLAMSATEREELLAFVAYPFADPILEEPVGSLCPEDLDVDGAIGIGDLLTLLEGWDQPGPGDLDGDGRVDADDVLRLLSRYGASCDSIEG